MTRRRAAWTLALAALGALLFGNDGARRVIRNTLELRRADRKLAGLKAEEAALKAEVKALKTDDDHLERAARRELGMVKPGEIEYRFEPPKP